MQLSQHAQVLDAVVRMVVPTRREFPGFAARRRDAVQRLLQLVGPAAEPLCIKMEKARAPDELAALLAVARQIVANQRGAQAGRDYMAGINPGAAAGGLSTPAARALLAV